MMFSCLISLFTFANLYSTDRFVRKYFYDMAADAVLDAVVLCSDRKIGNRMKLTAMFPEMNPSMDSYRLVLFDSMCSKPTFSLSF